MNACRDHSLPGKQPIGGLALPTYESMSPVKVPGVSGLEPNESCTCRPGQTGTNWKRPYDRPSRGCLDTISSS